MDSADLSRKKGEFLETAAELRLAGSGGACDERSPGGLHDPLGLPVRDLGRDRGVRGLGRHLTELRTLQDWTVTPLLRTVPGITDVLSTICARRDTASLQRSAREP